MFEGEYLYNWKIKGKEYIKGRLEYEGEYLFNEKWNGNGYDENGNIIYTLNKGTGKIKEYSENGKLGLVLLYSFPYPFFSRLNIHLQIINFL